MLRSEEWEAGNGGYNSISKSSVQNPGKDYFRDYPATEIKDALVSAHGLSAPFDELVATAEAVFVLIRYTEMNLDLKNAFCQLEKQFELHKIMAGY